MQVPMEEIVVTATSSTLMPYTAEEGKERRGAGVEEKGAHEEVQERRGSRLVDPSAAER